MLLRRIRQNNDHLGVFSAFQTFNTCCTINYIPELTPLATNISQDVASKNAKLKLSQEWIYQH
jgi:hypothetical protein